MEWTHFFTLPTFLGLLFAGGYVFRALVYRRAYHTWRTSFDEATSSLKGLTWIHLQNPETTPGGLNEAIENAHRDGITHPYGTLVPSLLDQPTLLHSDLLLDNAVEHALHQALGERRAPLHAVYAEARTVGMLGTVAGLMLAMADFASSANHATMMGALGLALGTTFLGAIAALLARAPLHALDALRDELHMEALVLAGQLRIRMTPRPPNPATLPAAAPEAAPPVAPRDEIYYPALFPTAPFTHPSHPPAAV